MGLFAEVFGKTEEEKKQDWEEKKIDKALSKVRFFPGTQEQYETLVGYEVKVIDTNNRDYGVRFRLEYASGTWIFRCFDGLNRRRELVDAGIEAIINCNFSASDRYVGGYTFYRYGLPVRRKGEDET